MNQSSIISVACHLPNQSVNTSTFLDEVKSQRFDIDNNYISQDIGINSVRHSSDTSKPSELASIASKQALEKVGLKPDQLDHIIFTGIEGDFIEPSTAHQVQKLIGSNAQCFDIKNACLGFMSAIYTANALIASGLSTYILICTGEKNSNLTKKAIKYLEQTNDPSDFRNTIGFLTIGDSGGAMIIGPANEGHKLIGFQGLSSGKQSDLCHYSYHPDTGEFVGKMFMARICSTIISQHHQIYSALLPNLNWLSSDIDYLIVHQVGEPPLRKFSQKLDLDYNKLTISYKELGNLTTNTLAANLALYEDKMKSGDKVYFAMSGSGTSVQHAGMIFN